jgi:hypothetical protein
VIVTLASFCLLAWLVWDTRTELAAAVRNYRHDLLAASIVAGLVFTVVQAWIFATLVVRRTVPGPLTPLVAAFLLSQPSKYVPGKVWPVLVQSAVMGSRARPIPITLANLELFVISLLHLLALGLLCLANFSPLSIAGAILIGPALGTLVVVLPVDTAIRRLAPKMSTRLAMSEAIHMKPGVTSATFFGILVSMLANLIASALVLLAIGEVLPREQLAAVLAVLYLGNILGSLVLIVPAGIGIREVAAAALGLILIPGVPAGVIITAAIVFRVWQVAVDVVCFAFGLFLNRAPAVNSL